MPRLRRVAILAVCTLIVAALAVVAVEDPFHLRHARWFTAGLVLLAIVLATAMFAVAVPRGLMRGLVLVLGGAAAGSWCLAVWVATTQLTGPEQEVSRVADGDRRLVVLEGGSFTIGPVYAVVLRSGGGPFEQETVVYQGPEGAPAPSAVRFVDADTVEVRTAGGCLYRSEYAAGTLAVDPVHRPLRAGAC